MFQYGAQILTRSRTCGKFEDERTWFDFWEAVTASKIRNVEGYRNYNSQSLHQYLSEDDDDIETIWNQEHSLTEFLDPSNFKSYAELKARLDKVLGVTDTRVEEDFTPAPSPSKVAESKDEVPWSSDDEDDEESLSFFKSLAEDD